MLIYIDDSVKNTLLTNCNAENKAKIENVFQDMYTSLRKNRHIIYGEPDSIDELKEYYKTINGNLYQFFKMIDAIQRDKYEFFDSELRSLFYAHVFFDDKNPQKENKRFKNHIDININQLEADNDLFEDATILLVENRRNDAKFYKKVVEYYIFNNKNYNSFCSYNLKPDNGGGSVIKDCYEEYATDHNHFCIAITDNDCKYEGYVVENGTASNCIKNIDTTNGEPFNCNYLVIDVRDIENLVPLGIIKNVKEAEVKTITEAILSEKVKEIKIIKYFDYKKGITTKGSNPQEKEAEITFWKTVFSDSIFDNPQKNTYVKGFGETILKDCIPFIGNNINLESEFLEKVWRRIGRYIFSHCCVLKDHTMPMSNY